MQFVKRMPGTYEGKLFRLGGMESKWGGKEEIVFTGLGGESK